MPLDDPVFERLFRAHFQSVAAFVYRLLGDYAAAEDVATNAFMALWERRELIADEERARLFLYTTARNLALNALRDDRNRERLLAGQFQPGSSDSIESDLNTREIDRVIRETISRMSEQRRAAYSLRYEREFTNAQVAQILGVSVKAVEKHMTRALAELREALKDWK